MISVMHNVVIVIELCIGQRVVREDSSEWDYMVIETTWLWEAIDGKTVACLLNHHHHNVSSRQLFFEKCANRIELGDWFMVKIKAFKFQFQICPSEFNVGVQNFVVVATTRFGVVPHLLLRNPSALVHCSTLRGKRTTI